MTLPIEVRVIDGTSPDLGGTRTYSVAAGSLLRLGPILEAVGAPLEDGLRVTVAIAAGTAVPSGGILAAAYTLDNRTQDAFAFVGQRQAPQLTGTGSASALRPRVAAQDPAGRERESPRAARSARSPRGRRPSSSA